jgi:hypothetical protein
VQKDETIFRLTFLQTHFRRKKLILRNGGNLIYPSLSPIFFLYKCSELKSKDFKPQEKRERNIGKTVGVHAVGGGGADQQKEGKKEIADNKNPEQTAG